MGSSQPRFDWSLLDASYFLRNFVPKVIMKVQRMLLAPKNNDDTLLLSTLRCEFQGKHIQFHMISLITQIHETMIIIY